VAGDLVFFQQKFQFKNWENLGSFVFWFLDKFANCFNHKIEKKKNPPTYGTIESAFLVTIFFKLEKGVLGFLVTQISRRKK